jgi:hypothetical protein
LSFALCEIARRTEKLKIREIVRAADGEWDDMIDMFVLDQF